MRFFQCVGVISLLLSSVVQAGHIVYGNPWSESDLVQGFGQTMAQAMADASAAKPVGYILDPGNSWGVWEMNKGDWMATRPIIKSNPVVAQSQQTKIS